MADGVNHQGSESGGNSRTCSISSQQASEVTSNADTGIVSETDLMVSNLTETFEIITSYFYCVITKKRHNSLTDLNHFFTWRRIL